MSDNQRSNMECKQMNTAQRIMAVAKYIWHKKRHKDTPGICRYCGKQLSNDYFVFADRDGTLTEFATEPNTKASARAKEIIKGPQVGLPLAFEHVACDIMHSDEVYYGARRQVEDWGKVKVEATPKQRVAQAAASEVF